MGKLQEIVEKYSDHEILKADGFDDAVLGVDANGDTVRLIYSVKKCIEILIPQMNVSDDDLEEGESVLDKQCEMAREYFGFNVSGAYVGEKTPIWCDDDFGEYETEELKNKSVSDYVPYQKCPKCDGQGTVSKPPYIAGDVQQWTGTALGFVCDVCEGKKVIPMFSVESKAKDEFDIRGEKMANKMRKNSAQSIEISKIMDDESLSIEDKSIKWWELLTESQKENFVCYFFGLNKSISEINNEDVESIFKASQIILTNKN